MARSYAQVVSGSRSNSSRRRSARKSYRNRVKNSSCKGKVKGACYAKCKYVSGKKRSFCRKRHNTRRKK